MGRRPRSRMELRAEAEAIEALGLSIPDSKKPRTAKASERRPSPELQLRMRVVWAVCDIGGRTVANFDYPRKADAELFAADLKARGKGAHFVRSMKEQILG